MSPARTTKKSGAANPATTPSAATVTLTASQMAPPPPAAITTDADTRTAAGVATLSLVQQARLSRLNRAATAAVAAYGAGSSQAAAVQQAVAATRTASSRLTVLHAQLTTTAPTVAAAGWALHGRVYDSNLKPLTSYTVFLVDGQNNYLSDYGFAYTDDTGYFLLNYDAGTTAPAPAPAQPAGTAQTTTTAPAGQTTTSAPSSTAPAAKSGQAGSAPSSTTTGATAPSSTTTATTDDAVAPQAFLQIVDDKANPVLLSTTAFAPNTGQATYQVITIPAGAASLGDPPASVRAAAMPPPRKAS
jgi:hypothetical protein